VLGLRCVSSPARRCAAAIRAAFPTGASAETGLASVRVCVRQRRSLVRAASLYPSWVASPKRGRPHSGRTKAATRPAPVCREGSSPQVGACLGPEGGSAPTPAIGPLLQPNCVPLGLRKRHTCRGLRRTANGAAGPSRTSMAWRRLVLPRPPLNTTRKGVLQTAQPPREALFDSRTCYSLVCCCS
jgi:hypothetical protein